jgi:hypothetical protein
VVIPPWDKRRPLRRANTRYPPFQEASVFPVLLTYPLSPRSCPTTQRSFCSSISISPSSPIGIPLFPQSSLFPSCLLHYVLNLNLITTHSLSFSFTLSFSVHVHWASSVSGTLKFGHVFSPFLCVHSVSPSSPHAVSVDNYVSLLSLITVTPPPQLALFTTMFPLHAYFGPLISPLFSALSSPCGSGKAGRTCCVSLV